MALKPTDMMPSLLTSQFKIICHTTGNVIKIVIKEEFLESICTHYNRPAVALF